MADSKEISWQVMSLLAFVAIHLDSTKERFMSMLALEKISAKLELWEALVEA
ncbi:MAG: hypothetical protein WCO05_04270 [Candidatus Moraniibacteriota bacterium]